MSNVSVVRLSGSLLVPLLKCLPTINTSADVAANEEREQRTANTRDSTQQHIPSPNSTQLKAYGIRAPFHSRSRKPAPASTHPAPFVPALPLDMCVSFIQMIKYYAFE